MKKKGRNVKQKVTHLNEDPCISNLSIIITKRVQLQYVTINKLQFSELELQKQREEEERIRKEKEEEEEKKRKAEEEEAERQRQKEAGNQ